MRRVITSPRAQRQLRAAERWWLSHRDKAPAAFDEDLQEGVESIVRNPTIYPFVNARRGIRRMLLERIRYYVYYRVNKRDEIELLSIWHASRRPPRL
jgi:plasmid stabilization system protein ParE